MTTLIFTVLTILAGTVVYLNVSGNLSDDSIFEEIVEEGIEHVIGIDIDLSPGSDPDE